MVKKRCSEQASLKGVDVAVPERLRLILYASQRSVAAGDIGLDTLVRHADKSNAQCSITGCLIAIRAQFAQCIEGPAHAVATLMAKIANDPRHHSIIMLRDELISRRRFADWNMGYVGQASYAAQMIADAIDGAGLGANRQPSERLLLLMEEFVRVQPQHHLSGRNGINL
jgi:hypothetical protein